MQCIVGRSQSYNDSSRFRPPCHRSFLATHFKSVTRIPGMIEGSRKYKAGRDQRLQQSCHLVYCIVDFHAEDVSMCGYEVVFMLSCHIMSSIRCRSNQISDELNERPIKRCVSVSSGVLSLRS